MKMKRKSNVVPERGKTNDVPTTNRMAGLVAEEVEVVDIHPLELATAQIRIVGVTPLITHQFSAKAQREIEAKQQGTEKVGKAKRNPKAEYEAAMYKMGDGSHGIKTIAFKQAACRSAKGTKLSMQGAYGAFHIVDEFVKIEGSKPKMHTAPVRIGQGVADIRYRPMFWPWSVLLTIRYNKRAVSLGQLCNLFTVAGFATGVGELRPEKKGHSNGQFKVELGKELAD